MLREKIRGGKHKMYSPLHSHLTAVAIDFFKSTHWSSWTAENWEGRCGELPLSGQSLQCTHIEIQNEKRINSNNLFLRTEACLKSFGGSRRV